jgi:flagellar M-ring protein FliF
MVQFITSRLPTSGFKLDSRYSLMAMAGIAAALAIGVVVFLWRDQGSFHPLYGSGEAYPVADVMQILDTEGIAYNLHPQTGQVLVRDDQIARARMLLSAKGIQAEVPAGYELFDKEEPLGTSQFVQDVRLKRSMEGELARSIMTMKGVENARVHLALQDKTSFVVSKRDPAKASVMLQVAPGYKLKSEQVSAIVNLVSSSVPQLATADVSVVDQQGVLLSRGLNESAGPVQSFDLVNSYQVKAVTNVEEVLAPVLGAGNYRISVAADVDFSQREETLQSYGDNPRMRSEILRDESVLDSLALGVPGSLSNRPVPPSKQETPAADGTTAQDGVAAESNTENKAATSLRKESNRQLEYDQSVTHVKHAPFTLQRQSVAVVINASSAPKGGWTPEARSEMEAMVKSAVGFDEKRGDILTLSVFPFTAQVETLDSAPWWESNQIYDLAKMGVLGLVSLLLIFMVVRPALRDLIRSNTQVLMPAAEPNMGLPMDRNEQRSLNGDAGPRILGEFSPLAEIHLPAPGSGLEMQVEHLQMLAKNDPERVSEVLKQWIGRNERTLNPAS